MNLCGLQWNWPKYFIFFSSLSILDREAEHKKAKLHAYNSSFFSQFKKQTNTYAAFLPSIVYVIFGHALRGKLKIYYVQVHGQGFHNSVL